MRIRTFVAAGAILLASFSMLADTPGGRAETRIIFGGNTLSADGKNTVIAIHDTWEFDGTTWNQRGVANAPALTKPTLAYDEATNQVILLGLDETSSTKSATAMYLYDANTGNW